MALSGVYLPQDQSDFIDLIFQGKFEDAIRTLNADPCLDVNFFTDHPCGFLPGISPFMMACYFGEKPLALALLMRGARIDAVCLAGRTALHYAAIGAKAPTPTSREELIYLLTYLNRDLLTKFDKFGNLPIHLAAQKGKLDVVKTLLAIEHCLKYIKNSLNQKTPLDMVPAQEDEQHQSLRALLFNDKSPTLEVICAKKIAEDHRLRADQQDLPKLLQEKVALFTPMITKWLEKLAQSATSVDELSQKLGALKLTTL